MMFDASTKIPNGVLAGNFFDFGNFDECYNIKSGDIYGKYCLGTLQRSGQIQKYSQLLGHNVTKFPKVMQLHPQPRMAGLGSEYVGLHFAACVPDFMKAAEIPGLLNFTEELCYSKATEPRLSTGAIVTIVILSIFAIIILTSTIYDIFLYYNKSTSRHELFVAFSILTNGRKIFTSTANQDQLLCLNGMKAISMMWVIIGHEFSLAINGALSNILEIMNWQMDAANMFIMGATVSVDTFFVIGGLVTVYTFLKSRDKGVKFNVILFYIHRYLRLTPALGVMALIHIYLLEYFGNGPLWKVVDVSLIQTCKDNWWSTLLYITNFVREGNCLPQTWYLSVDMQLFILSPIILLPLARWPFIGLGILGFLTVAGVIVPFGISYGENMGSMMSDPNYMLNYYVQTYTRFGPYVMGMILGYVIYVIKKTEWKLKIHPKLVVLIAAAIWFVSLTGLVACIYAGHDLAVSTEYDRWGNALFIAFNRPAWALALCGVIFLCVTGYGGPINAFLSLPVFQFLTKLSYSMYLVHYLVITVRYSAMKNIFKFSNLTLMHNFWGDFIFTLFFSLILCLAFESPIIIIEKYLFGRGAPRPKHAEKNPKV
ncbi:nose resistant to fluoxetine protein 6-like [Asbolus verrucosus]|uniref:Nose resistant to fluoxetine protein 6-like n=1 Tax=Asbolus verrucosus TaxID=1661398 RepID=A0A482VVS2_ASBVE|nr:nose resistant to fluoxetine protein 6-like [Asbolus verrucosus]